MGNQSSSSRTDTIVKLVLIFFIALLSFSVGTFVGKQVSDSDHRAASLEKDYQSFRDVASVDKEAHKEARPESAISAEEVNNLTEEFVKAERDHDDHAKKGDHKLQEKDHKKTDHNVHGSHVVAQGETQTESKDGYKKYNKGHVKVQKDTSHKSGDKTHTEKGIMKTDQALGTTTSKTSHQKAPVKKAVTQKADVSKAAKRVAEGKAPSKDVKKKRLPSSILPSVATSAIGKYTVQVASYATEKEAKTHAANLKWQGYSAFYIPARVKGKTWYRVSVGLFANQKSATNFRADFIKQSGVKTAIIQKIIK